MIYKLFEALGIQSSGSPGPPMVNHPRHQPKLFAHTTALTEFTPSPSRPLLADLASRSGSAAWSLELADALLEAQSLG